jgi:hypothetical protein
MMEAVRTSQTSVDNHFTRQYNPEDSSEHHTRRRENLKSHNYQRVISQDHTLNGTNATPSSQDLTFTTRTLAIALESLANVATK